MDRGTRRDRTARGAAAQLRVWTRTQGAEATTAAWLPRWTRTAGHFKKRRALACGCRKHGRGCSPKLTASLCHRSAGGYHPAVRARIEAKRYLQHDRD